MKMKGKINFKMEGNSHVSFLNVFANVRGAQRKQFYFLKVRLRAPVTQVLECI